MHNRLRACLIATTLTLLPAAAQAGSINIQLLGMGSSEIVTVAGVRSVTAYAGEIKWTPTSGVTDLDSIFYSYCVDLLSNALGSQTVEEEVLAGAPVAWLYNSFSSAAHLNSAMAAGLQLAIWNVLYDKDFTVDFVTGEANKFWLAAGSADAKKYANEFLSQLSTAGALSGTVTLLNTNAGQDQITAGSPVPEPATLLLLGSGIAALAVRRKMRRGTAAAV